MDETTLHDIRQRVARWQKEWDHRGKPAADHEAERAWCFAVNIDDVSLLFQELDRLTQENEILRLQVCAHDDPIRITAVEHLSKDEYLQRAGAEIVRLKRQLNECMEQLNPYGGDNGPETS